MSSTSTEASFSLICGPARPPGAAATPATSPLASTPATQAAPIEIHQRISCLQSCDAMVTCNRHGAKREALLPFTFRLAASRTAAAACSKPHMGKWSVVGAAALAVALAAMQFRDAAE